MNVSFRNRKLARCYADVGLAVREWGPDVGRRYVRRVDLLRAARSVEDLRAQRALDVHALRGNRAGQHGLRLTGRVRLIVTFSDAGAEIEEVVDYHG